MELFDLVLFLVSIVFGSALGAFFYGLFRDRSLFSAVTSLETDVDSLQQSIRGQKSGVVRQEKAERINSAMAEAAILIKEGKQPMDVFKELAPKYPDVALDLVKRGGFI